MAALNLLLCSLKARGIDISTSSFSLSLVVTQHCLSLLRPIGIVLVALCLSFSTSSANDILGQGDFETGDFSQWVAVQNGGRIDIERNIVRQGNYAARFKISDGDVFKKTSGERAEVSSLLSDKAREGDDYYYAWSTLFPRDFPSVEGFGIFMQWHSATSTGLGPPISLRVLPDGYIAAAINLDQRGTPIKLIDKIEKDIWHDFVVRVRWSCSDNGMLEIWHKLENQSSYKKVLSRNTATMQYFNNTCQQVYEKLGFYRSARNTATHVIYHDGFIQGRTFNITTKHAHNTSPIEILPPSKLAIKN